MRMVNNEPRLKGLGLDMSHQWAIEDNGDCWNGDHTSVECLACGAVPFAECFFELREGDKTALFPGAAEPCSDGKAKE